MRVMKTMIEITQKSLMIDDGIKMKESPRTKEERETQDEFLRKTHLPHYGC